MYFPLTSLKIRDHELLIAKLCAYGFDTENLTLKIICSYLREENRGLR